MPEETEVKTPLVETLSVDEIARQVLAQLAGPISSAISSVVQSQTNTSGQSTSQRNMEDVGETERTAKENVDAGGLVFGHLKRGNDEFLNDSLDSVRRTRLYADKILSDSMLLSNQLMQNAIENANLAGKQAIKHSDIATDRTWNVDEQGYQVSEILRNSTYKEALAAAVAAAVKKSNE